MDVIGLWNRSATERREIAVFGMACSECRDTVVTVLEDVDGARVAEVSLEEGRAVVDADPELDVEALLEAVRTVGYEARLVP